MAGRSRDITGERFGRLLVVQRSVRRGSQLLWLCLCDCGSEHRTTSSALRSGRVKSCGCLNQEKRLERNMRHGHAARENKHPLYWIWQQMIKRCSNSRDRSFEWYGARGIDVCKRWRESFAAFLADVGPRPPGRVGSRPRYTLDRKDNDGNYEPGNVRWATHSEQAKNRRSKWRHRKAA